MTNSIVSQYLERLKIAPKPKHIIATKGPSGAGKSYIIDLICHNFGYELMCNITSRPMRKNEKKFGSDYSGHISVEESERIPRDLIITGREIGEEGSVDFYGLLGPVVENNIIALVPNSVPKLKDYCVEREIPFDCIGFYSPPDVCAQRMLDRGDDLEDINKRLRLDSIHSTEEIIRTDSHFIDSNVPKEILEKTVFSLIMQIRERIDGKLTSK